MHTAGAGKLEFGAPPFVFSCGPVPLPETIAFTLQSPTTCVNVMKVCTREGHTLLSLFLISERAAAECYLVGCTGDFFLLQILRALQLSKPLLIEGSPGVGKTSLVQALARASGHRVVRINLSEQTDMMDLLGSDLPSEDGAGEFTWCDGIFLRALKNGDWILLDELNLAPQSVLEGLSLLLLLFT